MILNSYKILIFLETAKTKFKSKCRVQLELGPLLLLYSSYYNTVHHLQLQFYDNTMFHSTNC